MQLQGFIIILLATTSSALESENALKYLLGVSGAALHPFLGLSEFYGYNQMPPFLISALSPQNV